MTTALLETASPLDIERVRADFPILDQEVNGHRLVYLDNAASTQKPAAVIEAIDRFYRNDNANVHRGVHELSHRATEAYEQARGKVARLLGIADEAELLWTKGTTEGLNLVARTWGDQNVRAGDEILLSVLDHHSNLVPWQLLAQRTGARLRFLDIDEQGRLDLSSLDDLLTKRTKLVSLAHISNALGTINPIEEIARRAHAVGAVMVVDGAQSAPHLRVDVGALGCDFFACSGHKLYGPTGVGVLYGRAELLERMPPWQGGGGMIASVTLERSTWAAPPERFEAGTPPIAEAIALGTALDYVDALGLDAIGAWEHGLLRQAVEQVGAVAGVRLIGNAAHRAAVLSFVMDGVHPHDAGAVLDDQGIAVRAGHHCAQPDP
jgi:cysteine desulfurase/selenocysteine lyase